MVAAVGLPDLHPGRGTPIGAAFLTKKQFYPHLIGNDIGCGIGLWQTELKSHKAKLDRWEKNLSIEGPWEGDRDAFLLEFGLSQWDDALGTIGGGNHFAEVQKIDRIVDEEEAAKLGLDKRFLQVMVHSGSRGLGSLALRRYQDRFGSRGLEEGSEALLPYLKDHDACLAFAVANRTLIARRMFEGLKTRGVKLTDMIHNSLTQRTEGWLHRKGAAPSDGEYVLIPGSRGSVTYVVKPSGPQEDNLWSVAHGAGRKWNRSSARGRLEDKFHRKDLERTSLGSRVICHDSSLLYEEAPQSYKDVNVVVSDLVNAGLVTVVAILAPVLTYKVRRRDA